MEEEPFLIFPLCSFLASMDAHDPLMTSSMFLEGSCEVSLTLDSTGLSWAPVVSHGKVSSESGRFTAEEISKEESVLSHRGRNLLCAQELRLNSVYPWLNLIRLQFGDRI